MKISQILELYNFREEFKELKHLQLSIIDEDTIEIKHDGGAQTVHLGKSLEEKIGEITKDVAAVYAQSSPSRKQAAAIELIQRSHEIRGSSGTTKTQQQALAELEIKIARDILGVDISRLKSD